MNPSYALVCDNPNTCGPDHTGAHTLTIAKENTVIRLPGPTAPIEATADVFDAMPLRGWLEVIRERLIVHDHGPQLVAAVGDVLAGNAQPRLDLAPHAHGVPHLEVFVYVGGLAEPVAAIPYAMVLDATDWHIFRPGRA